MRRVVLNIVLLIFLAVLIAVMSVMLIAELRFGAAKNLENDPNGFNVSYSVGYAGLVVWDGFGRGIL